MDAIYLCWDIIQSYMKRYELSEEQAIREIIKDLELIIKE